MANYFLDTSAFVKRYHPETSSDRVLDLFSRPENHIYVSRLTLPETRSAFALKVRTGHIAESAAAALWIQVLADLAAAAYEVLPVIDSHFQLAEGLIGRYGSRSRLRTLDALQLAVALDWNNHTPIDGLVLADQALSEVAAAEKLPVILLD